MPNRVELQPTGWYDVEGGIVLPLLTDIYLQDGTTNGLRKTLRRIADLERRGS